MAQGEIENRLEKIEESLKYIQNHMIDTDMVLTEEEKDLLEESITNEKEGNLTSLEEIKNVRNKTG